MVLWCWRQWSYKLVMLPHVEPTVARPCWHITFFIIFLKTKKADIPFLRANNSFWSFPFVFPAHFEVKCKNQHKMLIIMVVCSTKQSFHKTADWFPPRQAENSCETSNKNVINLGYIINLVVKKITCLFELKKNQTEWKNRGAGKFCKPIYHKTKKDYSILLWVLKMISAELPSHTQT